MPDTPTQRGVLMHALYIAGGLVLYVLALIIGAVFDIEHTSPGKTEGRQS